eukprot:749475-Hanusia_phi.AAC.3
MEVSKGGRIWETENNQFNGDSCEQMTSSKDVEFINVFLSPCLLEFELFEFKTVRGLPIGEVEVST